MTCSLPPFLFKADTPCCRLGTMLHATTATPLLYHAPQHREVAGGQFLSLNPRLGRFDDTTATRCHSLPATIPSHTSQNPTASHVFPSLALLLKGGTELVFTPPPGFPSPPFLLLLRASKRKGSYELMSSTLAAGTVVEPVPLSG